MAIMTKGEQGGHRVGNTHVMNVEIIRTSGKNVQFIRIKLSGIGEMVRFKGGGKGNFSDKREMALMNWDVRIKEKEKLGILT